MRETPGVDTMLLLGRGMHVTADWYIVIADVSRPTVDPSVDELVYAVMKDGEGLNLRSPT